MSAKRRNGRSRESAAPPGAGKTPQAHESTVPAARPDEEPVKTKLPPRRTARRGTQLRARRTPAVHTPKAELRKTMRARRASLAPALQRAAAKRVLAQLVRTPEFRASRRIACYLPDDGEIDTRPLIERIWRAGKEAYLPVLAWAPRRRLWFARFTPGTELVRNRLGIPEPHVAPRERVPAARLDLILLPLVAFDPSGNRLGRGAGFYDRSLAFLRGRRFLRRPHLLGLAHEFQRVPAVPADPWDVVLDGVVTDCAVYYANR
ncbi:MAG TPA: 5-formyltetrahydrofolate cyclo-ligase [Burkholderiales bacterium]